MKHNLLSISSNEKKIFEALRAAPSSPLLLAQKTGIPRPTVYVTLDSLAVRGLVERKKRDGKHYWQVVDKVDLEKRMYELKKILFDFSDGREDLYHSGDSFVVLHRGKEAIQKLLLTIFKEHKNEKMYGIQGEKSTTAWENVLPPDILNDINKHIKENHILMYAILEKGWALSSAKKFGKEWVVNFEGRTTSVHEVSAKYMGYSTEIWLFKNSVYMLAPGEEIVIELKNSELVLMMKSLFSFVEDNSHKVDINHLLRGYLKG